MKYQNWKSYLSKSLFILFLALAVLLMKLFPDKVVADDININYLLNGMIFTYGVVLILIYLIVNNKYLYLLNYGLIYACIGCVLMFIALMVESYFDSLGFNFVVINSFDSRFNMSYFEFIIIACGLLHGIFKLSFSDTYSKLIRAIEIVVGALFVLLSLVWLYIDIHAVYANINIEFLNSFNGLVLITWFILVLTDTVLFVLRLVRNRKFIKEEIEEQMITSRASFRQGNDRSDDYKKKKRRAATDIEVIDLEKFFKQDEANEK